MDSQPLRPSGGQPYTATPSYPQAGDASSGEYQRDVYGQPSAASAARWVHSSLGIDPKVGAGLSYLPLIGVIFIVVEKSNRFIRFHAAQATLIYCAFVVLFIIRAAMFGALDRIQSLAVLFLGQGIACVFGLVTLAFALLWLWGLILGFTGRYTKLPFIGELAETWAGGASSSAW